MTDPKTPPTSLPPDGPLQHTPPEPLNDTELKINQFLAKYRPGMLELVKVAHHVPSLLPSWEPKEKGELDEYISTLHIPKVSTGEGSLLLHALGEVRNKLDNERIERIPDVFDEKHKCVI